MFNLNQAVIVTPAIEKKALRNKLLWAAFVVLFSLPLIYLLLVNIDIEQENSLNIQGIVLNQSTSISPFSLLDHKHNRFTEKNLWGKWHIITYGYTQCPDICPTTLMALTELADLLNQSQSSNDVRFVFYSIDPNRDSVEVLSQYIQYFDRSFIALKADLGDSYQHFESSLGIKANITQTPNENNGITVSHNLSILIINPNAELQAVLLPVKSLPETMTTNQVHFTGQQLYRDFLTVKNHFNRIVLKKI